MTDSLLDQLFGHSKRKEHEMTTETEQGVMPGIEGGLFVWITRPGGSDSTRQQERVRSLRTAHGVVLVKGKTGGYSVLPGWMEVIA